MEVPRTSTIIENNVHSIRMTSTVYDSSGNPYNRACYYFNYNHVDPQTSVASSHPGWYNNTATFLASMKVVNCTHSSC